jgi:hypothetical protein
MSETLHLEDLALEMGQPIERLVETVIGNRLPRRCLGRGIYVITEETADRLRSIYRNASQPTQVPRPTPEHLREEYTTDERRAIRQQYVDSHGPERGDRP